MKLHLPSGWLVFRVEGLGFRVEGLGLRVQSLGFGLLLRNLR